MEMERLDWRIKEYERG